MSVKFNLNEDFICIHYNKYILIHFMNSYITKTASKYRIYTESLKSVFSEWRAHNASTCLEDTTASTCSVHKARVYSIDGDCKVRT